MKIKKVIFEKSSSDIDSCPKTKLFEIAFIGRSNVGKSSILNTLLNKKGVAKVSKTPGKTKLINYFLVNDNLYFVDLPGYGYAKLSKNWSMNTVKSGLLKFIFPISWVKY